MSFCVQYLKNGRLEKVRFETKKFIILFAITDQISAFVAIKHFEIDKNKKIEMLYEKPLNALVYEY